MSIFMAMFFHPQTCDFLHQIPLPSITALEVILSGNGDFQIPLSPITIVMSRGFPLQIIYDFINDTG